ncbi:MAG: peptidase M28 [Bacteroidetes bacterium]|nr:MAG: peptidase M28 [Bacteroidota bacterium]
MKKILAISLLLLASYFGYAQNNNAIHHVLDVQITPETSQISVIDSIFNIDVDEMVFSLNAALTPTSFSKNVKVEQLAGEAEAKDVGMDREDNEGSSSLKLNKWKIKLKKGSDHFVLQYSGKISAPFSEAEENYQRGFAESPGIISETGIYLAGSTYWIPTVDEKLSTYQLSTTLPDGWKTVSQGERTVEKMISGQHFDTWFCDRPQEEIFLIGAKFHEYSHSMNSGIKAMAFLRTPDEGIANKYLEVTEQYMKMYQDMIGPYPYTKFALVENFWETGYGMPSFTLLGEKVIRFPFILHSSYPHELLHNWWGNSVYVDFETGNWCEGITAYEADHLIKEQRGQGEAYRRSTLQKFTNVVDETNDFPVNTFLSRHDAASASIGYGKSLMMWHMLRRQLGDEDFKKTFALFNKNFKFKVASFNDIRRSAEEVSGMDLSSFFTQWLTRTGAPEIGIKEINVIKFNNQYRVFLTLEQKQNSDAFTIDIPVVIATEKGLEHQVVNMSRKSQEFQFMLDEKPLKLVIDPQYDVFRILDPMEVPPAWSKVLASKNTLIVLPSKAEKNQEQLYQEFIKQWQAADKDKFEIVFDDNLKSLPKDRAIWIVGFENEFVSNVNSAIENYISSMHGDSVRFENKMIIKKNHSFIVTVFDEQNVNNSHAFIAIDNKASIPGLIRKLPHYGKYSYLAFEGDEPVNVAKGQWPILNSPLVKVFESSAQNTNMIEKREALATLAPVFSEKRMMKHIEYLASEELKGRGLGTPELDAAADYIAGKFKEYGLQPMNKSYFQKFAHTFADKGEMQMKNVIGIIPGTDEKLKDSPVVLSAHYDHLGLGWPDVRKGNDGKIHYGADDNASGVSIMLELAKSMAKTIRPKRTIIFVAFTAEEAGLIGSRYFVSQIKKYYTGDVIANINLDTDGRLFDGKLIVINSNSAKEWKFVFMGTDYTTGVKTELITQDLDASDQVAFIEKGIPAVQLFTGANEDYHRPSDTYDKIDGPGLVKVATVTKEVVVYLGERDLPFEYTGKAMTTTKPVTKPTSGKRASTGSIPDFSFSGEGVKLGSVMKDSPAEKAGLLKGDVITAFDGKKVSNLREYSELLKQHQPNDVVEMTILREGKEKTVSITLGER